MKKGVSGKLFLVTLIAIYSLDQLTKYLANNLQSSIPIIKNILHFTFVKNTGATFGILKNQNLLLSILAIIVLVAIIHYYKKTPYSYTIPLALITAGTLGNLTDRILHGYVIDFIDFQVWPVFNIADSALVIAVTIILIKELKNSNKSN